MSTLLTNLKLLKMKKLFSVFAIILMIIIGYKIIVKPSTYLAETTRVELRTDSVLVIKGQVTGNYTLLNNTIITISDSTNSLKYYVSVGKSRVPKTGSYVEYEVGELNIFTINEKRIALYRSVIAKRSP